MMRTLKDLEERQRAIVARQMAIHAAHLDKALAGQARREFAALEAEWNANRAAILDKRARLIVVARASSNADALEGGPGAEESNPDDWHLVLS